MTDTQDMPTAVAIAPYQPPVPPAAEAEHTVESSAVPEPPAAEPTPTQHPGFQWHSQGLMEYLNSETARHAELVQLTKELHDKIGDLHATLTGAERAAAAVLEDVVTEAVKVEQTLWARFKSWFRSH